MTEQWVKKEFFPHTLLISGAAPFLIAGSALLGGGLSYRRYLLNMQVPHGYNCDDPLQDMRDRVAGLGLPLEETAAMMTAADVDQVVEAFAIGDQFRLQVYLTAGVGNAARAGQRYKTYPGYTAGTINTIAVIDGQLTEAAMINAVMTVTEAKAAALQDMGITERNGRIATGTTTDSVIVACTQSASFSGVHQYAGLATELGNALAMTVHQSLLAALQARRDAYVG